MPSERVLDVLVRRQVIDGQRPFPSVPDGVFGASAGPTSGRCSAGSRPAPHGRQRNCALARCGPSQVADQLDSEVLELLRHVSGCRHPECSEAPRATVPIY